MGNQPNFKFCLINNCLKVSNYSEDVTKNEDFTLIPLQSVSVKQLEKLRNSNISGFVLKQDNHYYYADISEFKNCRVTLEHSPIHKCATCGCLSAASDEDGGCAKVRAFSSYIENFAWITHGYETFNTTTDVFMVFNCQHWKNSTHYPTHPITQHQTVMLAQFLWENIDDYNDVKLMMLKEKQA